MKLTGLGFLISLALPAGVLDVAFSCQFPASPDTSEVVEMVMMSQIFLGTALGKQLPLLS